MSEEFRARFESALRASLKQSGITANVAFERAERTQFESAAKKLEAAKPDIYYATTADIARVIRRINPTVPIIFSGALDPRVARLLTSIERPENNMTGFVSYEAIDRKRIELLADLIPNVRRVGLVLPENTFVQKDLDDEVAYGRGRGLELIPLIFTRSAPAGTVTALASQHRVDALDVPSSQYALDHEDEILRIGREGKVALSFRAARYVQRGGLMSYEPREFEYPEKAAGLVARVLLGTKPADIPIEFPSEFIFAVNLKTAATLRFQLNKEILKRANVVYR